MCKKVIKVKMYSEIPMPSKKRTPENVIFFTFVEFLLHKDSFYRTGEKLSKCKTLLMINNKGDIFFEKNLIVLNFKTAREEKRVLKLFERNNCIII